MEIGIKGYKEVMVVSENTAATAGSGLLEVFSTPSMVALMEGACSDSVLPYLEEGKGTVGTSLVVKHLAATPIGMKVTCESVLTAIDRRKLTFDVKAYDEAGLIGECVHERFIIDNEPFMEKAQNRKK